MAKRPAPTEIPDRRLWTSTLAGSVGSTTTLVSGWPSAIKSRRASLGRESPATGPTTAPDLPRSFRESLFERGIFRAEILGAAIL